MQTQPTPPRKRFRWLWASLLALLIIAGVVGMPYFRYLAGEETVITLTSTFPGCGGTMVMTPDQANIRRGTRVRFVNAMDVMSVQLKMKRNPLDEKVLLQSPWLEPGQSWTYTFWQSGPFYVTDNVRDEGFLAGLKAWLHVRW